MHIHQKQLKPKSNVDIREVLEIVFLPEWSTHAYICKDGGIYIQFQLGKCFNKESFLEEFSDNYNDQFIDIRLRLFEELENYYLTKHRE